MLNVKNIPASDRVKLWRGFLSKISHIDARRLRHLVFSFPNFLLKVHIEPHKRLGERLSYEYTGNYDDDYDNEAFRSCSGIPALVTSMARSW